MFCSNCGNQLSDDAKFCSKCGSAVESAETVAEEKTEAAQTPVQEENIASVQQENVTVPAAEETTETMTEDDTPAVTIAEMEAEKAEQSAVAVAEKAEETAEETAEEKTAEQTAPVSGTPEFAYYEYSEEGAEQKETKKKGKTGLIIGTSAAVVVAGTAAVCYGFFSNECMITFMGKDGFAGVVEKNSAEYLSGGDVNTEEMDKLLAEYVEQMVYAEDTDEAELTKSMLDEVLSVYGDSSVKVTAEFDSGMLLSMLDSEGMLNDLKLESVIEAAQGEDCDRISFYVNDDGSRYIGADLYIQDEKTVIALPELTSQLFYADVTAEEETEEEAVQRVEFSVEEMTRIREKLVEIYTNNLKNAEIEHIKGDADLVLADQVIEDERLIIRLSAENTNTILKEIGDFLRNDEYLRNYYVEATEKEITEYEKIFDETEYDAQTEIVIENYISDRAKIEGKKISVTDTDKETGKIFTADFETTMGNCDFTLGDDELKIDFTQRKTDEQSGIMEMTFTGEELGAPLVLEMVYSGVDTAEYRGQTVNTGTYTLKVSEKDEFFDYIASEANAEQSSDDDMSSDTMPDMDIDSMIVMLKDTVIESSVVCDGQTMTSSFRLELPLLFDLAFSAEVSPLTGDKPVMPDYSDALDINGDFDDPEYAEVTKEIMENIVALAEDNKYMKIIADNLNAETALNRINAAEGYSAHYAAYTDEIRENADKAASELYGKFNLTIESSIESFDYDESYDEFIVRYYSGEEMTVKVYFDENGDVEVLDDGGFSFVDFTTLKYRYDGGENSVTDELKNAYVEFVTGAAYLDGGVTLIYTDDYNDIPAALPTMYNFYDGVFEFDSEDENATEEFIIGTAPTLYDGVSTCEEEFSKLREETYTLNGYAEKVAGYAKEFFSDKKDAFVTTGSVAFSCTENGWMTNAFYVEGDSEEVAVTYLFNTNAWEEFITYLDENAEGYEGMDFEIHFTADENSEIYVAGVGAVFAERGLDFISYMTPEAFDYTVGYTYAWYYAEPYIEGVCRTDEGEPVPFGSYAEINMGPLGGIVQMYESSDIYEPEDGDYGEMSPLDETASLVSYLFGETYFDSFFERISQGMVDVEGLKYTTDYFDVQNFAVKLYYDAEGKLQILSDEGFEYLDFSTMENEVSGFDLRNIYAEIHLCAPYDSFYTVTVVETDDPANLPELPDMFDFAGGCFDWDEGEENTKDGFNVGTYPVLGIGTTDMETQTAAIKKQSEIYDMYAEQLFLTADAYFSGKSSDFFTGEGSVIVENIGGEWSVFGFTSESEDCERESLFAEDVFGENGEFVTYLNQNLSINEDIRAEILLTSLYIGKDFQIDWNDNVSVCGTAVVSPDSEAQVGTTEVADTWEFVWGYSDCWCYNAPYAPYIPGVIFINSPNAYGSYCETSGAPLDDYNALVQYFS